VADVADFFRRPAARGKPCRSEREQGLSPSRRLPVGVGLLLGAGVSLALWAALVVGVLKLLHG
jgi:hypothetical protein